MVVGQSVGHGTEQRGVTDGGRAFPRAHGTGDVATGGLGPPRGQYQHGRVALAKVSVVVVSEHGPGPGEEGGGSGGGVQVD